MKKLTLITFVSLLAVSSFAQDRSSRLGSLGGNKDIIRKAKELDPDNKVRVVQKRTVDRNWRVEVGAQFGIITGGDPYINTQNVGGNLDVHINPHWSVGARYLKHYNELSSEGERILSGAVVRENQGNDWVGPRGDMPLETTLGVVSFYPIYGKLNIFDLAIAQFDIYMLGGYGQIRLNSGSVPTWTAGGGLGLWHTQHFATRLEVRHQSYKDESGSRDINALVSGLSVGFIF